MKALVLEEYGHLVYKDAPDPQVGPEDVLIQVKACGICGSDIHGMDGSTGRRIPPLIMGHEASGVVVELGARVTEWKVGDGVTLDSTIYCGECHFCRRGLVNLCTNHRVLGVSCRDYRQHGAFAEYVSVPQRTLYPLPDGVSFEQAAMVEALSVAVHAVARTPMSLKDTAIVVGTGMIGLLVVQVLRAKGCRRIIAVDLDPNRLDLARTLGADVALNPKSDDVVSEVLRCTDGRGADIALEAVGNSTTVSLAIQCLRMRGSLTLIGNLSPEVELPLQTIVMRELNLFGSCRSCGGYPDCLDMISRGDVSVDALISAVVPLSDGPHWFERLRKGEAGLLRVILTP